MSQAARPPSGGIVAAEGSVSGFSKSSLRLLSDRVVLIWTALAMACGRDMFGEAAKEGRQWACERGKERESRSAAFAEVFIGWGCAES